MSRTPPRPKIISKLNIEENILKGKPLSIIIETSLINSYIIKKNICESSKKNLVLVYTLEKWGLMSDLKIKLKIEQTSDKKFKKTLLDWL